jgi:hypothetical protein
MKPSIKSVKNVQLKTPVSFTHFASKSRRKHISPTGDPPPAMAPSSNFFQRTTLLCIEILVKYFDKEFLS